MKKVKKVIETTPGFSGRHTTYEIFDTPTKDMHSVEFWEDRLDETNTPRRLVQNEIHLDDGQIVVLGYNILTNVPYIRNYN